MAKNIKRRIFLGKAAAVVAGGAIVGGGALVIRKLNRRAARVSAEKRAEITAHINASGLAIKAEKWMPFFEKVYKIDLNKPQTRQFVSGVDSYCKTKGPSSSAFS